MVNSKQKGKRGELDFANWMKENWKISARRGQQFKGSPDSPDLITSLSAIHFEVKLVERLNVQEAMTQAEADGAGQIPVVAHRRNRTPWLITLKASDAHRFALELMANIAGDKPK